jgi:hypothetical protein
VEHPRTSRRTTLSSPFAPFHCCTGTGCSCVGAAPPFSSPADDAEADMSIIREQWRKREEVAQTPRVAAGPVPGRLVRGPGGAGAAGARCRAGRARHGRGRAGRGRPGATDRQKRRRALKTSVKKIGGCKKFAWTIPPVCGIFGFGRNLVSALNAHRKSRKTNTGRFGRYFGLNRPKFDR